MVEERQGEREDLIDDSTVLRREDVLVWARDLTNHFTKTVSSYEERPLEDHAMRTLQDTLMDKFRFFLERVDCLTWDIAEFGISYKDEIIYENTEENRSLAFRLYREGIEQVRFERGLQEWEVSDFMDAIAKADALDPLEDDLITLLWERECPHIQYVASPYPLEDSPTEFAENVENFRKALIPTPLPTYQQGELVREYGLDPGFPHQRLEDDAPVLSIDQLRLQPEAMDILKKQADVETRPEFYFHAIGTLFEVMSLETDPVGFKIITSFLSRVMDSLLENEDFKEAAQILKRLYMLMNSYNPRDWQTNLIKQVIIEAGEPSKIEIIGNILRKDEFPDLKGAFDYFLLLQRNSISHLCGLLGDLSSSKPRRIICDALSKVGRNGIELMAPFLEDKRWYLVRNIVYILGRIGNPEAVPCLGQALRHPDVRVRREALQALGFIGGSEAMKYMMDSLDDRDPKIRGIAALNLGRMGEEALAPLMERMLSKEFHKKELQEIRAFFKAVAMIRSNDSIPGLYSFLEGKKWFGRGKADEIRSCAIDTLVRIGTDEAREVLEVGMDSRDEFVREKCHRGLMELS
jgi:hypothetical protein